MTFHMIAVGAQGGQYTVEGTLVSDSHPDAVFALLSDFDSVADVFGSILESRTTRDGGDLHLTQARKLALPLLGSAYDIIAR